MSSLFEELGKKDAQYYQMKQSSFYYLIKILKPNIYPRPSTKKKKRDKTHNGGITLSTRVIIALRYFAGGSHLHIALVHGVSHTEVF